MTKKIIKLYLKEHISLFVSVLIVFILSGCLALLEKDFDYLYLGILSLFVFSAGMGIHFFKNIPLYQSILSPVESKEDFFVLGNSSLAQMENKRMKRIYGVYSKDLNKYKQENEHYKIIMSKWVHQMKTPVSVLNLMAQDNSLISPVELREEVDRMEYLLNQILHLIRMENLKNDFIVERCHLNSIVKTAINEQKNYFIQKEVYPKVDVSDSIYVYTDKKWFSFAIQQVLNNAIKYSQSGQSIHISATREEEKIILQIEDFGSGIRPEDQPRIFDFCFTGFNGREKQKESSGLGLYITKNILDYLGHEITMISQQGKGTKFQVYLPTER